MRSVELYNALIDPVEVTASISLIPQPTEEHSIPKYDMVSEDFVRNHFASWETDDPIPFFQSLPEKFTWTVIGAINPLKGLYTTKEACLEAFGSIMSRLAAPPVCKIVNVLVAGDSAVVEISSKETSKAGKSYDEMMIFVVRYEEDKCVEIRMYADTAVEKEIFEQTD